MDDILIHDASENDKLEHLKLYFSKDQRSRFKFKLSKCTSSKRYLQHLGHLISGEGVHLLKEKVQTILQLAPQEM